MKFWKFDHPAYKDYIYDSFINGYAKCLFDVPYGACPTCELSGTIGEYPFPCPKRLSTCRNLIKSSPMPLDKLDALLARIEEVFKEEGIRYREELMPRHCWLQPGISFGDREFSIGCHPPYSFLWGEIGRKAIVKQEVKIAFEKAKITGVTFLPVKIKHVGKIEAEAIDMDLLQRTLIPHWVTEENVMVDMNFPDDPPNVIPPEEHPETFGPLFYMSVPFYGSDWRNWGHMPRCKTCGREKQIPEPKKLVFRTKNLLDLDVFRSAITNSLVVTQRVYEIIMDNRFTNCLLTKLDVAK